MANFLLELYCEEIPARLQKQICENFSNHCKNFIYDNGYVPSNFWNFITPRRMGIFIENLPNKVKGKKETIKGPKVNAPEKALNGFKNKYGISDISECKIIEDKKGNYYQYEIIHDDIHTDEFLKINLPLLINKFSFEKSMKWGDNKGPWIRPLKSVLCLLDDEIVEFELFGQKSNNKTIGNYFFSNDEIIVSSFAEYKAKLAKNMVVLTLEERLSLIQDELRKICLNLDANYVDDDKLIQEIAGLVEYPFVCLGKIDKEFLHLPKELLFSVMIKHQKYIPLTDKKGDLIPYFVFVMNYMNEEHYENMKNGFENVLVARLKDATYYIEKDKNYQFSELEEKIEKITFFKDLGNLYDKSQRMAKIASFYAPYFQIDEIQASFSASCLKLDLASSVVFEFPELQGVIGNYLLPNWIENDPKFSESNFSKDFLQETAKAISEHYAPKGLNDQIPTSKLAMLMSICDKIDNLCQFWSIKQKPTSSKDPYALRRSAISIIRILLSDVFLPLADIIASYVKVTETKNIDENDLLLFFKDRLFQFLKDKNYNFEILDLIINFENLSNLTLFQILQRIEILQNNYDKFEQILQLKKRLSSMIDTKIASSISDEMLENENDKSFYHDFKNIEKSINNNFDNRNIDQDSIKKFEEEKITKYLQLAKLTNEYIDNNLINSDDQNEKITRHSILLDVDNIVKNYINDKKTSS